MSQTLDQQQISNLFKEAAITAAWNTDAAPALGRELRVEVQNSREFGLVVKVGVGGVEGTLETNAFRKGRATIAAAVELVDAEGLLELFQKTHAYQRLSALEAQAKQGSPDQALTEIFSGVLQLANQYSPSNTETSQIIETLIIDPLVINNGTATIGAAEVQFGDRVEGPVPRPIHKIDKLIHPESIGIIGVSGTKMNFGRIILHNVIDSGYDKARLTILKPGDDKEVDGVKCVPSLADLENKLDLLIVAVPSGAVYDLVDQIIATDAVEAVMLIPGSLGETKASVEPAAELAAKINKAHLNESGGPIFLGANCLGVVSHPGNYDSWFIPLERLPKPQKKKERNSVMLSQSGAFMITRLSRNPWLDPRYMLALGNQTDLTHGDMLTYFAELPELETIGIYIEGFKDLDGLHFARAVRKATLSGKQVVIYKSGRTEAGMKGVMGHTASIAGDPQLFESVLKQAGAIITTEFTEFDDIFYIAGALHNKQINGNRLGAISGAGFEAVGMADSAETDSYGLVAGELTPASVEKVEAILEAKRLSALVEVRNPIDINPGADDEAHLQISEAFAADPNIDAVVVGLDPTAPSVRSLVESKKRPGYDISDPKSTVTLMPELVNRNDKPIIGVVDGGELYDAMAAKLMDQGTCVFRTSSRAVLALTRYTEARLNADAIRRKHNQ
ncbi:MAG: CoA-binding protein [Rhodospirillales bacterium]|nr:CoA-binding protein [Rhodospirillales bacterium]